MHFSRWASNFTIAKSLYFKLSFDEGIDQKFKQAEKEIEDLQNLSVEKQKELHEKFNTH